jgi:hypothetical protein
MNKSIFFLVFLCETIISYSQVSQVEGKLFAKEYSKEIALYKAKEYIMYEIIGVDSLLTKFEVQPLTATTSGELTTLIYSCGRHQKYGFILGFFGNSWNDSGNEYKSFAFKNLSIEKANELLSMIDNYFEENSKYLQSAQNTNNIYFKYDDLIFLLYFDGFPMIRVFWKEFDSAWQFSDFEKTKKLFEKSLRN